MPTFVGHGGSIKPVMLFSTHDHTLRGAESAEQEEVKKPPSLPDVSVEERLPPPPPKTIAEKAPLDNPPKPVKEAVKKVPLDQPRSVVKEAVAPEIKEVEKAVADTSKLSDKEYQEKLLRDSQATADAALAAAAALTAAAEVVKKAPSAAAAAAAAAAAKPAEKKKSPYVKFAPQDPTESEKLIAKQRRERVKMGMMRAWDAYRTHAWGMDVVHPISLHGSDRWGSMAMTMLDSLSTLWVMNLKDEFYEARDWIAKNLSFDHVGNISVFETTIRALAGLLSAYDLSKDIIFLQKAKELGDKLLAAFNSATGYPINGLTLNTGATGSPHICLAEFGTLQVEFRYLSHATGDPIYAEKAMKVFEDLYKRSATESEHGLFKLDFDANSGTWGGRSYSVAARGDSFYEYLLKVWLQGNRKEDYLREMFDKSVDGMEEMLIKRLPSGRMYIGNYNYGHTSEQMEHLSCFLPGTLALGSATIEPKGDPELEKRQKRYMHLARELGETCYQFAASQATGLAPELVDFPDGEHPHAVDPRYILRPEVAESMYYLHLLDGDSKWREHAALMFDAIDTYCRTDQAYGTARFSNREGSFEELAAKKKTHEEVSRKEQAAHPSLRGAQGGVSDPDTQGLVSLEDDMESFFLAETLKYLYLIQETEPGHVDLAHQVFNTEAHPLSIFEDEDGDGGAIAAVQ